MQSSDIYLRKCFMIGVGMLALAGVAQPATRVVKSVVQTDPRTGKLVRKTVSESAATPVTQVPQPRAVSQDLNALIEDAAKRNQVEAPLVRSVIRAESNYNPLAVSNKGAQGLMQLIPSTAKRFGVSDAFDSQQNVEGGVKYLKYLVDFFHGDYARAIAAYNAGEAAVAKYGGVPPYKETRNYVSSVARNLAAERLAEAAMAENLTPAVAQPAPAETSGGETGNPVLASVGPDGRIFYRTP